MNRFALSTIACAAGLLLGQPVFAQTAAERTPNSTPQPSSDSQPRPDAKYPRPSGQDSRPSTTTPKAASGSSPAKGDPERRGTSTAKQSAAARHVEKQGAYRGQQGKKSDPGTACSTARATPGGGVDCGTGGEGATPGKIPK
jgi:hypothetical protein